MTDAPPRQVGRYLVLEEFASGGMATVHFGHLMGSEGFRRIVAIKRMRSELRHDAQSRQALIDEARLAARVQHVNVVQTLDVVADGDELLLVLEYVNGEALNALLRAALNAHAQVPDAIIVAVVSGALRGLHAAHQATAEDGQPLELVHRDVSPHNILIDVSGIARVTDFGIAKARGRLQSTQTGQLKGKLAYLSPEQVHGESSPASDVFAMGIVLWEMLALRRLFRGESEANVLAAVLQCEVPDVEGANPALLAVARRALGRLPGSRYPSALAMAEALEAVGPWASPTEVAGWLRGLVPESLKKREDRVRMLEKTRAAFDAGQQPPVSKPRSRWPVAVLGALALAATAGGGVWWGARSAAPGPAPALVPPAPDARSSPALTTRASDPSLGDEVGPLTPDAGAAPVVRNKPKNATRPPKPDCAVPWTLDANGRKKYKIECL